MSKDQKSGFSSNAMNIIFVLMIGLAVWCAALDDKMAQITEASFESAKSAVQLALNLVGVMALWLGLVRVLEAGGLMHRLALMITPLMKGLFPDVPPHHPAMGAMLLNMSANILGLGNAATPFGLKAMVELEKLNPFKGTATNAMCMFLAINTSSITILPLGVIGVRAAAGAAQPAHIFIPSLLATTLSTAVAIITATLFARTDRRYLHAYTEQKNVIQESQSSSTDKAEPNTEQPDYSSLLTEPSVPQRATGYLFLGGFFLVLFWKLGNADSPGTFFIDQVITHWLMPFLMLSIISYGLIRGVKVYEAVTSGAKQGFDIAVRIIPFLVAILVAIGMFRASGAMDYLIVLLEPITSLVGMPPEVLPMALIRPLSGTGAFAIMSALINEDPNSYVSFVASVMQGSTETTFYVLAVYFGASGTTKIRHALPAALLADVAGLVGSCIICQFFWS
jgi:spore maturation protein SpmA